jgi:hypothetical protein
MARKAKSLRKQKKEQEFQSSVQKVVSPLSDSTADDVVNPNVIALTLENCISTVAATVQSRAYTPPGNDALPLVVQTWRKELSSIRNRQMSTNHDAHSKKVSEDLPALEGVSQVLLLLLFCVFLPIVRLVRRGNSWQNNV